MPLTKVLIIGAGISGLAAAIALTKFNNLSVQLFELRPSPQSIGGAINLTPAAMRYLDALGVADAVMAHSYETKAIEIFALRTGGKLGAIDYDDLERFKFRGRRVRRAALLRALLEAFEGLGGKVQYGRRAVDVDMGGKGAVVKFEDGGSAQGDVLLGADGIHSWTRTSVVERERMPVYTGIAGAYGILDGTGLQKQLPAGTSMFSGRRGSLLMSYSNAERSEVYVAAVMETAEAESREGWKVKNGAKEALKADISDRFGGSPEPVIDELLAKVQEWFLYPVFKLPPKGKWFHERCLLIGDAAHAVSETYMSISQDL
jgi:2-polyprenyl-6-methoxyphenol hydroxylase-like FAD-dependent oxidoreductase